MEQPKLLEKYILHLRIFLVVNKILTYKLILCTFLGTCGTVAIVEGTYTYHHYMQDNFNDDVPYMLYRCVSFIIIFKMLPLPSHLTPLHSDM